MGDDEKVSGHRIIGTLRATDGKGVVRIEDRFDTTVGDLWSALIDRDRLARWLGEFTGDLRLGGEFRAHFWASGWEGAGRVDSCEPQQHLLVTTRETESSEQHSIEAWLRSDSGQTVLVIEERGMTLDLLAAYGAGIQIHIEDLAGHLAGRNRCDARARWEELIPTYQELAEQRPTS